MNAMRWSIVPTIVATVLATAGVSWSQSFASVSANSAAVPLAGKSLTLNSCTENVPSTPSHVVKVTEDSNLRFTVQSQGGQPTLLIRSEAGKKFCVQANEFSEGRVEIPGRWGMGSYSIYVGDRAQQSIPYNLTIAGN
ncbi:MAG: hypothetical protein KME16_07930 [Scytolyngbya sp. HA4215-MV1]|jgi:hypothetical protein|nr:hypothetical protein [Scytolyngbya sp. HA4215-MV1]